ncbi:MAG: SIS domain-containing protein [Acidimicrobiales bacterium]
MCGIIAVVRRRATRPTPEPAGVLALVEEAGDGLDEAGSLPDAGAVLAAATPLEAANALLQGVPGVRCLLGAPAVAAAVDAAVERLWARLAAIDHHLDADIGADGLALGPAVVEATNAALIRVRDAAWAIQHDRLRTARLVGALAGPGAGEAAIEACTSIQVALSALDRLEVRGRDSAGLHLLVRGHGLDLETSTVRALLEAPAGAPAARGADPLFRSGAVRAVDGTLSFVYKAAAEIGELGDNTAVLRAAIGGDALLALALASPGAEVTVVGHTRWASVGIVSEANAHPLNSDEENRLTIDGGSDGAYVIGAINGDVDNHADLRAAAGLGIAAEITTDSKVMPALVARRLADGVDPLEAFRATVAAFEGSVAIAAQSAADPDRVLLALRGSGQALYVGLAEDCFVAASEPYGVVEETVHYLRVDGETPASAQNPTGSRGQILALDRKRAGELAGIERLAYDATPLPITPAEVVTAEITTRDIDRGEHRHFLLKELGEAPGSFRKTLRGKLFDGQGADGPTVVLGSETIPADLRRRLADGSITRVVAMGQGTAAVAAKGFAQFLAGFVAATPLRVEATLATELSGFAMRTDMADTLVVAISQSGTTTDTNRTVDLVRSRGAAVVAIVNRRSSDLTDKADGVLYTSDGRDVEMAVPSTKAFYAQIAAGCLLAVAVADAAGAGMDEPGRADRARLLTSLRALPEAMAAVLDRREDIGRIATELAPARRYWAIVGNGPNRIAAEEVRIKLSELCYKSIACDATEDKKHVDLSAEPLILVCAAGLTGSTADDVAKEVAIYRAHKAAPVVIATEGEERFGAALAVIKVPETHPRLAFVLSAMAGHLFGYEAALAIDAQAIVLRAARAAIETAVSEGGAPDGERLLRHLRPALAPAAAGFFAGLRSGAYDGHLEASTATRLASLFRYALGVAALDAYQVEHGRIGTPAVVVDDLTTALTRAIEELTRPVDAIKHQAKTVTVGISRTDETLLQVALVGAVLEAGAPRDSLTYRTLRTLAEIDPAVAEVTGWIRYRVEGDPAVDGAATAVVVDRGGIARQIPSRTERDPTLRGTKHTVALERDVFVSRGRRDGRTVVIVAEVKDTTTVGLTLLHVRFQDHLPVVAARSVLQGYRGRFAALRDAVLETEPAFRDDLLARQPVVDLLIEPIASLADRWRA